MGTALASLTPSHSASLSLRLGNSNRKIYEKLELDVTCTKQTVALISNRKKSAFYPTYCVRFRTPKKEVVEER